LETRHILTALKEGADGVLILGCEDGHCHFQHGSFRTEKMVYLTQKVLPAFGIEPERVRIEMSHDPEGKKIPELVAEMKRDLAKLGPITRI
jgi:coenzyme F420-reducing hydrogenase delta subunit